MCSTSPAWTRERSTLRRLTSFRAARRRSDQRSGVRDLEHSAVVSTSPSHHRLERLEGPHPHYVPRRLRPDHHLLLGERVNTLTLLGRGFRLTVICIVCHPETDAGD